MSEETSKGKNLLPETVDRFEIRVSGAGGQGIISTGMLLGEAIAIGDGKTVTQCQSYGPEARGSATRTDIVVSDHEIFFPECNQLDLMLAFTAEAYEKYSPIVKPDGLTIADEKATESDTGPGTTIRIPFIQIAKKEFGKEIVANIIALGFLSTYTGIVSKDSIRDAVEDKFSGTKHLESNMKALDKGFELGKEYAEK